MAIDGAERGHELAHKAGAFAGRQKDGIDQDDGRDLRGVGGSEFKCDQTTEAVANDNRARDPQLLANPCHVVGEASYGVGLLGRIAGAVTTEVDGEDPVMTGEVLQLGGPEPAVTGHPCTNTSGGSPRPLTS